MKKGIDKLIIALGCFLIAACCLFLMFSCSIASAFDLEVRMGFMTPNDQEIWPGQTLEIRAKTKPLFLALQKIELTQYGQEFNIYSVGIGIEQTIWEHLTLWVKGGYYIPQYDPNGFSWEALYYAHKRYWTVEGGLDDMLFDNYKATIDNAFGGEIGLDAHVNLFDISKWRSLEHFTFSISASYLYLRLHQNVMGWNDGGMPGVTGWIMPLNKDFGGVLFYLALSYEF